MYVLCSKKSNNLNKRFAKHLADYLPGVNYLPRGKGNSSQQMGRHGKKELRKCVYIWRKL